MPKDVKVLINNTKESIVTDDPHPVLTLWSDLDQPFDFWQVWVSEINGEPCWKSEHIPGTQTQIRYSGKALKPKTSYRVEATLFDNGLPVATAEAFLEMGFLKTPWQAKWIEPEQENAIPEEKIPVYMHFLPSSNFAGSYDRLRPCRELKKELFLDEQPVRARLYASAHGIYELSVNGQRTDERWFAPETSAYDRQLYYQTYDVTSKLKIGLNTIEITLSDGWWIGRIGLTGESCQYGDRLGFIMQMELTGADGSTRIICSDTSFYCRKSHIDYADLFIGERRDFAKKDEPWVRRCNETDDPTDPLVAQPTPPIIRKASFDCSFFTTPDGDLMADFGQCLAGVVEIEVEAEEGTEVSMEMTETLDKDGRFFRNIIGRNKDQRDVFVCKAGPTHFIPHFTYHGFRYARLKGVSLSQIKKLKAHALGTDLEPRGTFTCSDYRLNQLQHCIQWSFLSNLISIPTDCPQREKMGWTGDVLASAPTACFNYQLDGFFSAWLSNMKDEQLEDGAIPIAVPNYPLQHQFQLLMNKEDASSAWSDVCVFLPWFLYQSYGNKRVLYDYFDMMEQWLFYVAQQCRKQPENFDSLPKAQQKWNDYLWNKGFHFGDWLIPSLMHEPDVIQKISEKTGAVIGSSFYAFTLQIFLNVIDALLEDNPESDVLLSKKAAYSDRLKKVKTAVRECYLSEDGFIENDLQSLYVMVLKAKITEGALQEKVAKRLDLLIRNHQNRLDVGLVTAPYLLDVLVDNGYEETARKLLFQDKSPSWLYFVENNATTLWENWEAIRPDRTVTTSSFNHHALCSVGDFIYRRIGGIQPGKPGYRQIRFNPDLYCGLHAASTSLQTSYGKVSCSWAWQKGTCQISLSVPHNTTGVYKNQVLGPGQYTFIEKDCRYGI